MAKARAKSTTGGSRSKTALKTSKPVSVPADPIPGTPGSPGTPGTPGIPEEIGAPAVRNSTAAPKASVRVTPINRQAGQRLVTRDDVARRAFEIWESKGRPTGLDLENWQQAERELGYVEPRE